MPSKLEAVVFKPTSILRAPNWSAKQSSSGDYTANYNNVTSSTVLVMDSYYSAVSADIRPDASLAVGKLMLGQQTGLLMDTAIDGHIVAMVDGEVYELPIQIKVGVLGSTVQLTLSGGAGFVVRQGLLTFQIDGFQLGDGTEGGEFTNYLASLSGPLVATIWARVLETPSESLQCETVLPAFNKPECGVGPVCPIEIDPEVPPCPVIFPPPVIPPNFPPVPTLPITPILPPIPPDPNQPGPPGPPGQPGTPGAPGAPGGAGNVIITWSISYDCTIPPVIIFVQEYDDQTAWWHFIFRECATVWHNGLPCCSFIWCDSEWKKPTPEPYYSCDTYCVWRSYRGEGETDYRWRIKTPCPMNRACKCLMPSDKPWIVPGDPDEEVTTQTPCFNKSNDCGGCLWMVDRRPTPSTEKYWRRLKDCIGSRSLCDCDVPVDDPNSLAYTTLKVTPCESTGTTTSEPNTGNPSGNWPGQWVPTNNCDGIDPPSRSGISPGELVTICDCDGGTTSTLPPPPTSTTTTTTTTSPPVVYGHCCDVDGICNAENVAFGDCPSGGEWEPGTSCPNGLNEPCVLPDCPCGYVMHMCTDGVVRYTIDKCNPSTTKTICVPPQPSCEEDGLQFACCEAKTPDCACGYIVFRYSCSANNGAGDWLQISNNCSSSLCNPCLIADTAGAFCGEIRFCCCNPKAGNIEVPD